MPGKLYLCATPIGNLDDMTFRVLETLKSVDLIAAEDTRNSIKLLNHFDIHTEMTSYHEYNKYDKAQYLIQKMQEGINVALITDAGTPAISDPGEVLVAECHKAGITVTSLPGPAACITALTLSGLPTRRFCFEGFLPSATEDKKGRKRILEDLKDESRTMIIYEAPHHLKAALDDLYETLGDRRKCEFLVDLSLRTPEVRHEHQRAALIEDVLDGRQGRHDAGVVGNLARAVLGHRNVEVYAHQDALARDVDVAQCHLVHFVFPFLGSFV